MENIAQPTEKRDLWSGRPLWLHGKATRCADRPLRADIMTDVAIVGAGVSGVLVADALLDAGFRVVVLDRRTVAAGSTAASTALIQTEIDQPLIALTRRLGMERAARAWWRSAQAVDALRGRIKDLGLRCGLRERHTVYLPGNVLDVAGLKREAEARVRIGLRSIFLDRTALLAMTGINRAGAIWSAGAAEVDPVRLVRGLWRHALARGAVIHAPVEVNDIEPGRSGVTLSTVGGSLIRAKFVVLATGYELSKMLRPKGYKVVSTWALATRPQPRRLWPHRCLVWEAADPYLYARTTMDGRVVAGGGDAAFSDAAARDRLLSVKVRGIQRKLQALFPQLDIRADFAWTGSFGESATGLPAIGAVPGAPGCYAVLGFGGNGITFSVIAAEMIRRALLGLPDPESDLFALT